MYDVSKYTRISISILFEDTGAVTGLRHSGPDFPHGGEDPRFLSGRHMQGGGKGTQLRHRLATPFDHDHAAVGSLPHQFRGVNMKFTNRRFLHLMLHYSTSRPVLDLTRFPCALAREWRL